MKTLDERQKELQVLLASPAGRKQLQELESLYSNASHRLRPAKSSVITFILVHEREQRLISD